MKTLLLIRHSIPEKSSEFTADPGLSPAGIQRTKEIFRHFIFADGESFREVNARMSACIRDILSHLPDGETALIVSHAAAICAYLQGFCTVEVTDAEQKLRKISFQGDSAIICVAALFS